MKSSIISTIADSISSGGTVTGDLTVEGDFVVEGGGSLTVDAAITGEVQIIGADGTVSGTVDADGNEFVIRNNADAGMSIMAGESSGHTSSILMGSTNDINGANIFYEYYTKTMKIGTQHASGILTFRSGNGTDAMTILANQDVGIGTASPEVKLHIEDGNLAFRNTYGIHIDDAGGTRRWALQMDAGDDITIGDTSIDNINFDVGSKADAMVILDGGNVGIGTASPASELEISGSGHTITRIAAGTNNSDPSIQLWDRQTAKLGQFKAFQSSGTLDYLQIGYNDSSGIFIKADGNVGIGNTAPGNDLEVSRVSGDAILELSTWSTTATESGTLLFQKSGIGTVNTFGAGAHTTAGETLGRIDAYGATNDGDGSSDIAKLSSYIRFYNDAVSREGTVPGKIQFATAPDSDNAVPAVAMTIDDGGNVGIGVTDPDEKVEIHGNLRVRSSAGDENRFLLESGNAGSDAILKMYSNTGTDLNINLDAASGKLYYTGGSLGIGTTSPSAILEVERAATTASSPLEVARLTLNESSDVELSLGVGPSLDFHVPDGGSHLEAGRIAVVKESNSDTNNASSMSFWTAADGGSALEKMRIQSAGNVGIGTTDPGAKLQVEETTTGANVAIRLRAQNDSPVGRTAEILWDPDARALSLGESGEFVIQEGNVGIGTPSPDAQLEIESSSTNAPTFRMNRGGDTDITDDDQIGLIQFFGIDSATAQCASIEIDADDTWDTTADIHDAPARIDFYTQSNGAADALGTPRMTIDSSGNVGIGAENYYPLIQAGSGSSADSVGYSFKADTNTGMSSGGSSDTLLLVTGGATRMLLDTNSRISLSNNDDGTSNTIFGKSAGASLDAGSDYNVFIGEAVSDAAMDDATNNVGVGYQALSGLTSGSDNTCIGRDAGAQISTGSSNVCIGKDAGDSLTVEVGLVCIGDDARQYINAGSNDSDGQIAIGYHSLAALTTGTGNTAIGYRAMDVEVGGNKSTAVGHNALTTQTTASTATVSNTAIGFEAGQSITSGTYNTMIGSETMSEAAANAITGSGNTTIGAVAGYVMEGVAAGNTLVGKSCGDIISTGTNNTIIGMNADPSGATGTNQTLVGYDCQGIGDNYAVIGDGATTRVYAADDVGATLYAGSATVETSDARIKEDIKDSSLELDFNNQLSAVDYKKRQPADYDESLKKELNWYKNNRKPRVLDELDKNKCRTGFIAQEVGEILSSMNYDDNNDIVEIDETNTQQMIAYSKLVPSLVKAVQELSAQVEELENNKCKCNEEK